MQAITAPPIADANESGALGVIHLKRYWSRIIGSRLGVSCSAPDSEHLRRDNILLAGLQLGVRETLNFLATTVPSFHEFEDWVRTMNGGALDPVLVLRLNAALLGHASFPLETALPQAVLSPQDLTFWDQHGYLVVKQAVSAEQCQAAVDAILTHAGISLADPNSWYQSDLWIPLAHHPALWVNRNSPRIHTAFAQIWQHSGLIKNERLWKNVDVCGFNPPLRPGYHFSGTPLHWDMTLAPPVRFGTQAILYLTNTAEDQGAFSCVPGLHRDLHHWLAQVPAHIDARAWAVQTLNASPVPGDAGDLVIWHQALPHAAMPNLNKLPRIVQYLNMFPTHHQVNADWI